MQKLINRYFLLQLIAINLIPNLSFPNDTISISGKVRHYDEQTPIQNATIYLKDDNDEIQLTEISDELGRYMFTDLPKNANYELKVNINRTNYYGITETDINLIARHLAMLEIFSFYQFIQADIIHEGDGKGDRNLNIVDLVCLNRFIVFDEEITPWEFYPSEYNLNIDNYYKEEARLIIHKHLNESIKNQDFIGFRKGDIDNSWLDCWSLPIKSIVSKASKISRIGKFNRNIYILNIDNSKLTLFRSGDDGKSFDSSIIIDDSSNIEEFEMTISPGGTIHIFWTDYNNKKIYHVRSLDNGNTFSNRTILTDMEWAKEFNSFISDSGTIFLVFCAFNKELESTDIYYTKSENNGSSFILPVRVSNDLKQENNPKIFVRGTAYIYIFYKETESKNILFVRSNDNEESFNDPIRINPIDKLCDGKFDVIYDQRLPYYIAYSAMANDSEENIYIAKELGSDTFHTIKIDDSNNGIQKNPKIFFCNTNNTIYVTWDEYQNGKHKIYLSKSYDFGMSYEEIIEVSDNSEYQQLKDIYADSNGIYILSEDISNTILYRSIRYERNSCGLCSPTSIDIYADNIIGNLTPVGRGIFSPQPDMAIIETSADSLLADNTSTLSITISFYTIEQQEVCMDQGIIVESSMGNTVYKEYDLLSNRLFYELKADENIGTARIFVKYANKELGSKEIKMIPGQEAKLVLNISEPIQEVDMLGNFITLEIHDDYNHQVVAPSDINIKLYSTAEDKGHFCILKEGDWECKDTDVVFSFKSNTNSYQLMYKSSIPGLFDILVTNDNDLINTSLPIQVIEHPRAILADPPSSPTKAVNYQLRVQGKNITHYQYQYNENEWSPETSIDEPIRLTNLNDGQHTLNIVGKNILNNWQNKSFLTKIHWVVDTQIQPPKLSLPSQWDTGKLSNDQITNMSQISLTGICEDVATIQFFDNSQVIDYETITFDNNTFSASFTYTEGTHSITAIQTDLAGNLSQQSIPLTICVDTRITNFTMNPSHWTDDTICSWALEPENIYVSGTREAKSIIHVNTDSGSNIHVDYPEDHIWTAHIIDMPTGNFNIWVQSTDIAGNTKIINKRVNRSKPETVIIETMTDSLLADNSSMLPITISFYTEGHQQLCIHPNVTVESSMGQISETCLTILNNQLICQLKADSQVGEAQISAFIDNNVLGTKTIEMIPGPYEQLLFKSITPIQEVDLSENYITLQLMDAYGHPVFIDNDMTIKISSTAQNYGHFYSHKGTFWDWDDGQVIFTFKPDINTFKFMYKASVPGDFNIQASNDQNETIANLPMKIVDPPLAILSNPPPTYTSETNFQFSLEGAITDYQFQLDSNAWQAEKTVDTPITFSNLNDGLHTLKIIGKNMLGNWQNKSIATTVQWTVDTLNPTITHLFNDTSLKTSKTWNWAANENCSFRFTMDQNTSWSPSGEFNSITTATKDSGDGKWYLHVQAKDLAGNTSEVKTVSAMIDNTPPIFNDLTNDSTPRQSKTWHFNTNESCKIRYFIDQNVSWVPSGDFVNTTDATINSGDGTWYLHVQAKDDAGNLTSKTVYATLDNTPPGINGLSDDSNHRKNKTWIWSASESCTFRYSIDQNATWEPLGSFNNTKTATKDSGDGKWYLHVQAKDQAGNLSNVKTVYAMLDNSMPGIDNLSNDSTPRQSKTWDWSTSENSTFRFAIDQNPTWQPSGAFNTQSTATKSNADGKWYLHVQAKDDAGNLSDVVTVFAILDNTDPIIHDLVNDTSPRQNKTWNWSTNENCTFRFSIDQHSSWQATGDFANTTDATINSGDGTWYLHVQAKDEAGNLTSKTVYTILDNTRPTINGLSDDANHRKNKTWHWSSNETCTFRYAIDQNAIWQATGSFTNATSAAKNTGDGKWYLHVQAKDSAGNLSHMTTVFVMLDNTNPVINHLSNDSTPRQSITWNWSTNENCTYRFAIDQNPSWEPTGEFGTQTTATKNNVDGKWYLHVQAKDDAGNLSELISVYAILDNTKPIIYHLADDASPKQTQTWHWAASESCTYRFIIDQNTSWEASGIFDNITSATKNSGDGQWYLHVQAKDDAGNLSYLQTVFAIFDNTPPKFIDLIDDSSHRQSKTWHLNTNESCQFRHSIDQNPTWTAIGEFVNKTNVAINSGDGKWYLHIQAKDEAGNLTSKTVFTVLDNTHPEIDGLSDDPGARLNKTWRWSANENCTFRFSIDQNPLWEPTGEFNSITTATKTDGNGNWYLHVQAKDLAGNLSLVKTVSTLLDNIQPQITGLFNDPTPTLIKIWNLQANEAVTFRFAINQQDSWIASGAFDNYTQAQKSGTMGKWFLHAQAKDLAGNVSETVTVSAEFIPPEIEFKDAYLDCNENDKTVNLALQLSHAIDQDVFVKYKLTDDIQISYPFAILGLDFELPEAPSATIPAGNVEGFIPIQLIDDHFSELKEAIRITLLESNVTLGMNDKHTIILTDNDKSGITIIKSTNIPLVVENQEPQSLTIVLDSQPEYEVTIHLSCDNQDLSIVPSELSFLSDQWNTHQHVYISRQNDDIFKGNDYIDISLNSTSNDNHYNQLTKNIIIQIEDDDPLPVPPPVICPKAPMNNNRINWCWNSGGGTNLFRFKIDNSDLTIDANMSGSVCHEYLFSLSDGLHTFYIQEYNEFIGKWSESSVCHIEIDTGLPCSKPESPVAVTAQSKQFTITYDSADRYNDSSCWNNRSGSGLSEVQLWVAAPNEQSFQLHDTDKNDNIDGVFEYTATKDGTYRFMTCAIDKAGNAEHESESIQNEDTQKSETIYTEHFSGYAILAVGAVTDKEGLDSHTLTADNIYKHLINRHFGIEHDLTDPLDHIKYYNPHKNPHTGVDSFELDNVGEPISYKLSFQYAIEEWAFHHISRLSGPLYIILIDHGAKNTFYLSDSSETVTPQELDCWISKLESKLTQKHIERKEIVIVVGTCYSGSFIPELSASGRIVIASSAHDEPSYSGPKEPGRVREGAFFVSNLFNELAKGKNLADSFIISVQRTEDLTARNVVNRLAPYFDTAAQHPLIDDDADSNGSNNILYTKDGKNSENIYLGFLNQSNDPLSIIATESNPPKILPADQLTVSFKAEVNKPDKVNALWLEIRKPGDRLPQYVEEFRQKELDLEEVNMTYHQGLNQYILNDYPFHDPGKYTIYFYVKDKEGIISGFNETCIYKNRDNNQPPAPVHLISPINLDDPENEDSDETEFTDVILQWENSRDPDFDPFTYAVYLSKSRSFDESATIIKEQLIETICLVKLPDNWDDSDVYWKVIAIDNYGAQSESEISRFHTDNPENALSVVFVNVYDRHTNRPIPNVWVQFESNDRKIDLIMNQQGHYIERFHPGVYDINIFGDHYTFQPDRIVIDQPEISLSFALTSTIQTGDINRNGKQDIGDAIQCLQVISGVDESFYYYDPGALTGDVIELRDAIFILQMLSEVY
jgi:hypothetical protein